MRLTTVWKSFIDSEGDIRHASASWCISLHFLGYGGTINCHQIWVWAITGRSGSLPFSLPRSSSSRWLRFAYGVRSSPPHSGSDLKIEIAHVPATRIDAALRPARTLAVSQQEHRGKPGSVAEPDGLCDTVALLRRRLDIQSSTRGSVQLARVSNVSYALSKPHCSAPIVPRSHTEMRILRPGWDEVAGSARLSGEQKSAKQGLGGVGNTDHEAPDRAWTEHLWVDLLEVACWLLQPLRMFSKSLVYYGRF